MSNSIAAITPPLKWAGGKRWLAKHHSSELPTKFDRYIEPFVGGGAIFFYIQPNNAIISDLNPLIISLYRAIKLAPEIVYSKLKYHANLHSDEYYYYTRRNKPRSDYDIAAWLLYLNRSCYNGLFRVNLQGQFNVPRGTKNKIIFEYDNFVGVSKSLENTEILCSDFEPLIRSAKSGDFIYLDPPYTVRHNNNGFVKYNETIFSWKDQERLAISAHEAANRGAQVLISNANHPSIRELYSDNDSIKAVDRHSVIGGGTAYRSKSSELLIRLGY